MRWFVYPYLILGVVLLTMPAAAVEFPNGSFEDTSASGTGWVPTVQDWEADPILLVTGNPLRLGLFQNFDGYTATDGDYFAIITNRYFVNQAVISAEIDIPGDIVGAKIEFDYLYATSWDDSTLEHLDPFTVMITNTDTGESWSYLIADNYDENLTPGSLSTVPFESFDPFYDTRWQSTSIDVRHLVGETIEVEFRIYDEVGGMSAAFLDNVRLTPEPGTLALFGMGLVGLTLCGRRKLRSRKG